MKKEKPKEECEHNFVFSGSFFESDAGNIIYHKVGYSVCQKCGEVRKNTLTPPK